MKKFVLKVLLFFTCVVVMDYAFGQFFSYLRAHAKGGSTANCEYIANRANEDIIILGSSRATHHYVPQIIEDSLGLSCYNCGEEGNGVILAYGRLKMLTNRYKPKLILYEITSGYDYELFEANTKYLGYLRQYYDKEGIKELFDDFDDELSSLKMKSKMYQNTSRLLPNLLDNAIMRDNHQGYDPLYGHLDSLSVAIHKVKNMNIDSLKLGYVEKILKLAQSKEIPVIFMISPRYHYGDDMSEYEPAIQLCEKYGVRVINNVNESSIAPYASLFQDVTHLNDSGARLYSQLFVRQLKECINI